MLAFAIRRLIQAVTVMLIVALISFVMFRFVGDPVNQLVGVDTSPQEREALRQALGLNDPMLTQLGRFIVNAAQFNFGISYQFKQRLPATVELALLSAIFALVVGIALGVYTAIYRNGILSHAILSVSAHRRVAADLPDRHRLIWLFAVNLRWLPSFGRGDVVKIGWWTTGF
jgi:peptide/nickel transport system permease protein